MLERFYVRPDTVDRIRLSWINEPIERYVEWLAERDYSAKTVVRRVPLLVSFGEYARAHGASAFDHLPLHVVGFVNSWLEPRMRGHKSDEQRKRITQCVQNPIEQMLSINLPDFILKGRTCKPENSFGEWAPDFFEYLRKEKGLREPTVKAYSYSLRRFSGYLQSINVVNPRGLSGPVLSGFVVDLAQRVGRASVRDTCGQVRVFLRYLYRSRALSKDLSGAIQQPHAYRLSNVPRSITWDEVRQMLETVDRRTIRGKRDYAILLLLVTYGLRAREVAALTLDDIDWKNERLRVPYRKADHSTIYPLSPIVGEAIIEYLKSGRPKTNERALFYRTMPPRTPLTYSTISTNASHYLRKAGIPVSRAGSHTLRHTCVQRLVEANFSLKLIGDYVGHRSPASTEIYSKVDIEALREVACGDGEEIL